MTYANNIGAGQPAHPRSLISTFVVRCLDSIIPLVSISELSSLYLASVAVQAGCRFESYPVANPEDRFSRDEAHFVFHFIWDSLVAICWDRDVFSFFSFFFLSSCVVIFLMQSLVFVFLSCLVSWAGGGIGLYYIPTKNTTVYWQLSDKKIQKPVSCSCESRFPIPYHYPSYYVGFLLLQWRCQTSFKDVYWSRFFGSAHISRRSKTVTTRPYR